MRHSIKRFDEVDEGRGRRPTRQGSILKMRSLEPESNVGAPRNAREEVRSLLRALPLPDVGRAQAKPNPNERREDADGPQAAAGLRQERDEDISDDGGPRPKQLAENKDLEQPREQRRPQAEQDPRVVEVGAEGSADGEGHDRSNEPRHRWRRRRGPELREGSRRNARPDSPLISSLARFGIHPLLGGGDGAHNGEPSITRGVRKIAQGRQRPIREARLEHDGRRHPAYCGAGPPMHGTSSSRDSISKPGTPPSEGGAGVGGAQARLKPVGLRQQGPHRVEAAETVMGNTPKPLASLRHGESFDASASAACRFMRLGRPPAPRT